MMVSSGLTVPVAVTTRTTAPRLALVVVYRTGAGPRARHHRPVPPAASRTSSASAAQRRQATRPRAPATSRAGARPAIAGAAACSFIGPTPKAPQHMAQAWGAARLGALILIKGGPG